MRELVMVCLSYLAKFPLGLVSAIRGLTLEISLSSYIAIGALPSKCNVRPVRNFATTNWIASKKSNIDSRATTVQFD